MTLRQELIEYSHSVVDGTIVACKRHKWACQRFLTDIKNEGIDSFPFVFKEEKAERFFAWVRLFKHTKGVLAGKPIEPLIIHKFIFGNIYGWYHKSTGYRRFVKAYWQVARKNSKSQFLSCVATYETMVQGDGKQINEVYCAATKTDQAKIVYDEAKNQLLSAELLKDKWRELYSRVVHVKTGSFMRALSAEDQKTGDGLNPQAAVIDEYHAHETSKIYDILDSGMGAREQPLLMIITTAGFELNYPCYSVEYKMVSNILDPNHPLVMDEYFVMINELDINEMSDDIQIGDRVIQPGEPIDDINDETCWQKANPVICSYDVGVNYLRKKLKEADAAPEKMRNFLTKHMNLWIKSRESSYMDMAKWAACRDVLPDLTGLSCIVGLDLSAKIDLASVAFEFFINDKYIILSHSFMPGDTFETRRKTDKVPYEVWEKQGWLTISPGAYVDYRVILDYIYETRDRLNIFIKEFCIDPWGMYQIGKELEEAGETVVEVRQGIQTLSEPTKDFKNKTYNKEVLHDGNPVLAWAISNAVVDIVDRNKNLILNKRKSPERIDPIAAAINAHVRSEILKDDHFSAIFI